MELRKKFVLRLEAQDTTATLVRNGAGHVWVETADGRRIDDAVVLDAGRTVSVRVDGRMVLVDLTSRRAHPRRALANGRGGVVELLDELTAAAREQEGSGPTARELRSEMPGLVLEVKCRPGDTVEPGQPVVVLEAMKMQNELGAPGEGRVEEILVKPGQSVEAGALLLRLAAPEETNA